MTVKIQVKFFAQLAIQTGCRSCTLEVPNNFYQAIEVIGARFNLPAKEKLGTYYSILINGKGYSYGLADNYELKDEDTLAFVPILSGG
ncbi:MoaD/ThiS family protein [Desulforamulus putei]|uniref:Molybdopterin converting factor, small subunit n=1 Tax=Desulforamulus putei DSM 12395 TaxID=1121429 RepID=A0A1M5BYG3_9FIRM|nr:MoaD/ThiS family protein [Desulforamulus putei]SHF47509.1 Molybdopterin converting factor, small subunit [Desulforamulus putei DSM 12395]